MTKIGELVVFRERGHLLLGIVLEEKGNKVVLLTEENKKNNIFLDKIEIKLNKSISLTGKEYEIAKQIKDIRLDIEKISETINLPELYELLHEENQGFTSKTLAEYHFSDNLVAEDHVAMAIALSNDSIYFKLKNDLYYPKPYNIVNEQIKEFKRLKLSVEKKKEERKIAFNWLKEFLSDCSFENKWLEKSSDLPIEVIKLLEPVKQYIIFRDEYDKKKNALDVISDLKSETGYIISENPIESMFNFFKRLQLFKEEENLSILKYHIPTSFKEKAFEEAENIKEFSEKDIEGRVDLRYLYTFTIDDSETQDIDDAISLEVSDHGYTVGVHIADVSYFIKTDSVLDDEALSRGMTVYLPQERISMFPELLSEHKMSLVQGQVRPALSFIIRFDNKFQLIDNKMILSAIVVDKKMTYEEVHELIESDEDEAKPFKTLYQIAQNLLLNRQNQGALEFMNPNVKIKLQENGLIYLKPVNHSLKSDLIVKEFMILSNHIAAIFCNDNKIQAIFICQEPPDESISLNDEIRKSKHLFLGQLKKMKKSEIDLYPRPHFALGLSIYTQATSPIRRYHDLIIHRQIKNFLSDKKSHYSKEEIQVVAASAEKAVREIKAIEKETTRYWLLKYLKQEKKRPFKAIVIRKLTNSYLVEIQEVFVQTGLITPAFLENDQEIEITIERVNPLLDTLSIRRVV